MLGQQRLRSRKLPIHSLFSFQGVFTSISVNGCEKPTLNGGVIRDTE
ncbi:hypothetical protein HDG32_002057 [Paraburkholderia sp. CI2]|nr:hypothetical protein [Paraburkholderia sp. CI2]